jgi:hypothetical protein
MKFKAFLVINLISLFMAHFESSAQTKGEPVKPFNPDSVFIFESPRPLITADDFKGNKTNSWGFNVLFSDNGLGGGVFIQWAVDKDLFLFSSLYISGARNTDEIDYLYPDGNNRVPGKINRLYMFPLTFGITQLLFADKLTDSFKPFLSAGLGPTFILSTPYDREFFNSFGYARLYPRFGAFLGIGAYFGFTEKSQSGINIRYYYIPYGGAGLESIQGKPIKDFGGIFLSLIIGINF